MDLLSTYRFVTEDEEVIEEEDIDEVSLKGIGQSIKKGAKDFFSVDDGGEVMSGTKDSATMKGLKSNKLPLLLAGIGSALGGLSWLTSTDWFKSLFDQPTLTDTLKYAKETVGNVFGSIKPGEGMTQILSRTLEGVDLDPSSSPEEFLAAIKRVGGGDITKGIAEIEN